MGDKAGHDPAIGEVADAPGLGIVHVMGAMASLAILGGMVTWGYAQMKRDVSGIPVVQAIDGPMRIAPENPGGQVDGLVGLQVNGLQGSDVSVPELAAKIALAPAPEELSEEDRPAPELRAGIGTQPQPEAITSALLSAVQSSEEVARPPTAADTIETATVPEIEQDAPEQLLTVGLVRSLRPVPRPARADTTAAVQAALEAAAPQPVEVSEVPEGTRLVQLGAFNSEDEARAAWTRRAEQFEALMEGKQRLVAEASAGGRTFWRLRAVGFEDLSDARRFCAALVAERAECIPVLAR